MLGRLIISRPKTALPLCPFGVLTRHPVNFDQKIFLEDTDTAAVQCTVETYKVKILFLQQYSPISSIKTS